MRFVAKYANYQIQYQSPIVEHFATGESQVLKPWINLEFEQSLVTEQEREAGRKTFLNFGMPVEQDGVTAIDPSYRFATWDSVIWQDRHPDLCPDDETREKVEQWLLARHEHGIDFLMVEPVRVPLPWPNYREFRGVRGMPTPERIVERVLEDGYDIEQVLAFERENDNRPAVIDALEAAKVEVPQEELVSA